MKRVESPADIPNKPHWVMLKHVPGSIHVEGDERSRTNPGHGYPAHDVDTSHFDIFVFDTEREWRERVEAEVLAYAQSTSYNKPTNLPIVAYHVDSVATMDLTVKVNIRGSFR